MRHIKGLLTICRICRCTSFRLICILSLKVSSGRLSHTLTFLFCHFALSDYLSCVYTHTVGVADEAVVSHSRPGLPARPAATRGARAHSRQGQRDGKQLPIFLNTLLGRRLLLAHLSPRRRERPRANKPNEHVARPLSGGLARMAHAPEVAEHLPLTRVHRLGRRLEARAAAFKVARVREQ